MIQEFDLPAPRFTLNPLAFLVERYRGELPEGELVETGENPYSLSGVMQQLERALTVQVTPSPADVESVAQALQEIREMIMRACYREAIRAGQSLGDKDVSDSQREELVETLFSSAVRLVDDSQDELEAYETASRIGLAIAAPAAGVRTTVAMASLYRGITLRNLGNWEDAITVYDQLIDRFGDDEEGDVRTQVATALRNKGFALGALDRNEDAITVYDELIGRFGDDEGAAVRTQVVGASRNKGVALRALDRSEDAITVYDELLDRFGDDEERDVRRQVARALRNKGFALRALDRNEDAISAYDELLNRFDDDEESEVRAEVARALRSKGIALGELDRSDDEISV